MTLDIRQAIHPADFAGYDTDMLRENFLIEEIFVPGEVSLTYWHTDRLVIGGAMPAGKPLKLETHKAIGHKTFLARRELGICNVGGPGKVTCDGTVHQVNLRDMLYVGMGTVDVAFSSDDPANPAKFYLLSTPAHATHPTVLVREADANALELGTQDQANTRTLRQYIIPGRVASCQLVMGLTTLKPGNIWNTMPAHVHDRRCEAYLYFDMKPDTRVFHLMGEPQETRHLVVANDQAIISPPWSIHSGCGTAAYSFVWAMGGDNQDFTDMDMIPMEALR